MNRNPSRWLTFLSGSAIGTVLVISATLNGLAAAQAPLTFEAATVKPVAKDERADFRQRSCRGADSRDLTAIIAQAPLGRCTFGGVTLAYLIRFAYDTQPSVFNSPDDVFTGGPTWLKSDLFNVAAEADNPTATTEAQLKQMLQTLLAERFKLTFHHQEGVVIDGYALVAAKDGPKIRPGANASNAPAVPAFTRGSWTGHNQNMKSFSVTLSGLLGHPVMDQTGLTDAYNFTLTWTPGENERPLLPIPPGMEASLPSPDPNGPSIFTALQEQLGLRLESRKVPVEVIVIDHVEKP